MSRHRLREFVIDPSSGQYSASRLLLMVLILVYIPAMGVCEALGIKLGIWAHIAVIVGSVAGIYGVNSGVGVWQGRRPVPPCEKPCSPAKPEGE